MEEGVPRTVEKDQGRIDLMAPGIFPYTPRPSQMEIVAAIRRSMAAGEQLVMESGTGTGRRSVPWSGRSNTPRTEKRRSSILQGRYLRAIEMIKELRNISKKKKVTGLPVLGRARSCALLRSSNELDGLPSSALSKICEQKKRASLKKEKGGCPHYSRSS